jgi:rhodanese-related sulfurtransferase
MRQRDRSRPTVGAIRKMPAGCNSLSPQDHHAVETNNFARPGRIPGSLNVFMDALLNHVDGTFRPVREIFANVLSRPSRKVTYCGVGIAATSDALALSLLGESDVAVYDGSLEEWTSNAELPSKLADAVRPTHPAQRANRCAQHHPGPEGQLAMLNALLRWLARLTVPTTVLKMVPSMYAVVKRDVYRGGTGDRACCGSQR